jgi:hypothetical protein
MSEIPLHPGAILIPASRITYCIFYRSTRGDAGIGRNFTQWTAKVSPPPHFERDLINLRQTKP